MKMTNYEQAKALMEAVDKCERDVYLKSIYGDVYNLKSTLSQMLGIAELFKEHGEELELFCDSPSDETYLLQFFYDHPEIMK